MMINDDPLKHTIRQGFQPFKGASAFCFVLLALVPVYAFFGGGEVTPFLWWSGAFFVFMGFFLLWLHFVIVNTENEILRINIKLVNEAMEKGMIDPEP